MFLSKCLYTFICKFYAIFFLQCRLFLMLRCNMLHSLHWFIVDRHVLLVFA